MTCAIAAGQLPSDDDLGVERLAVTGGLRKGHRARKYGGQQQGH